MTGSGESPLTRALTMRRSGATLAEILAAVPVRPSELLPRLETIDSDPDRAGKEEITVATDLLEFGEQPWQLYLGGFSLRAIAAGGGWTVDEVRHRIAEFVDIDDPAESSSADPGGDR